MDIHRAYFYGVLLGDGHINYTPVALADKRRGPMMMLKVCDLDFIETWRDAAKHITGFEYKISKHNPGEHSQSHRQQYKLRITKRWFVDEAETLTKHKTIIPKEIFTSPEDSKKAFITGLMDSEGWINCRLTSVGMCDLTLGFGCCDDWIFDFYELVNSLGIKTSKIYHRKPTKLKSGGVGKPLKIFKLDILDYKNKGLSFSIKRKSDRLDFCSRILNDYTQNYPIYKEYY